MQHFNKLTLSRVACAVALGLHGCVWAQVAQSPVSASVTPSFAIRGFNVKGENPLGDGETSKVLAPFLRSNANIVVLQKATVALESALRDKGFGLHRVSLPPQEVGDTVTLEIVKFSLGNVHIEGATRNSEANIRRSVPELQVGATPNFKRLAVQTGIANDNPSKQITVSLKESDQPDKIDASVKVKDQSPWTFSLSASNTGAASSGRDRLTFSAGHANLFDLDHQFVAAYTTSVERTQDVKQLGLSYKVPLYEWGGVLGANLTQSDVLGNFSTFTSTGAGRTLGLNFSKHLQPDGGQRSYVNFALDDKLYNATIINGAPVGVDRRSRPLTLGYSQRNESDTALWAFNVDVAHNLSSGAANTLLAYQAEDPRITTVSWKTLRSGANYSAPFATDWLWAVRGQLQLSSDALISGEQFGLGGVSSVRGAPDRTISGDKGLSASLEVTSPEWLQPGLRVLGFIDAGWLANNNPNGANKPSSDKLSSWGLGLRYSHKSGASLSMDYGRILGGSVVPLATNPNAIQRGADKLHLNFSVRF